MLRYFAKMVNETLLLERKSHFSIIDPNLSRKVNFEAVPVELGRHSERIAVPWMKAAWEPFVPLARADGV